MSLERLIDLASRTGDRLIVHNPMEDADVVIMSVQEYENLLDNRRSVHGLSSDQMLEQINRDISVWRSNRDEDEEWDRSMQLEDELLDEEMEDFIPEPWDHSWHRAGDVLDRRYGEDDFDFAGDLYDEFDDEEDEEDEEDFGEWKSPTRFDRDYARVNDFEFESKEEDEDEMGFPFNDGQIPEDEIKVDDIPFGPVQDIGGWEEEPLPSDEPVFYEEPV